MDHPSQVPGGLFHPAIHTFPTRASSVRFWRLSSCSRASFGMVCSGRLYHQNCIPWLYACGVPGNVERPLRIIARVLGPWKILWRRVYFRSTANIFWDDASSLQERKEPLVVERVSIVIVHFLIKQFKKHLCFVSCLKGFVNIYAPYNIFRVTT